jgi:CubicO group peptidase (beta-lactamase class C family)
MKDEKKTKAQLINELVEMRQRLTELKVSEAQTQTDPFNGVRDLIRARLVEPGTPSLAVAVAQDKRIIWEEGFGWADRENRVPATEYTMYSLASISKPITATGLMVLKERGALDLDRPINDYLGEARLKAWVGGDDDATVRRVANHSSGLPLHYHFFPEDEPYRRPPMDETIRRYGHLVTVPGEKYQYANLGYGLLDYVISRLSGKNYPDFMRQEVFLPLGMTHASVDIGPGLEEYQAVRYGADGLPIPFYDFDHPGASAAFSSAHDLVRFGMFHLKAHLPDQKAILSDETIDSMQQPTMEIEKGQGYGIGWALSEDNIGYRSASHGGGMSGVSTILTMLPTEKLAVVVLANASSPLPHLISQEILAALLPEYAENHARREAQKKREGESAQAPTPSFQTPPELIGKWSGNVHTYMGELPLTVWFKKSGDIHAQLGAQLKTLLNDVSFKNGYLGGRMMGDIGTEDANRKPYHLHVVLKLREQALNGVLIAISLPGQRLGNALSHWVELKKQEDDA